MIDWITAEVPCVHEPLFSGLVTKISPDGEIEWSKKCWSDVVGSHDANIRCMSVGATLDGRASHLLISGNPAKWLQGHNVFGPDNLSALMLLFSKSIFARLGLIASSVDLEHIRIGEYRLRRIDITYSYSMRTRSEVLAWLRAAEFKARTRAGRPISKGSTLYFQKNSRRWALKFYCKAEELEARKHQLPNGLIETPIKEFAENILRAELTLRSTELSDRGIARAKFFTPEFQTKLFNEHIEKIDMNAQLNLSDDLIMALPQRLQRTYCMWEKGIDLRRVMKHDTFYRHRRDLLAYDVDIANQPDGITELNNVVPLIRVLEAKPIETPQWAYQMKLIAC